MVGCGDCGPIDPPVFTDADHEEEDEADRDADHDSDDDREQQAFATHQHQPQRCNVQHVVPISRGQSRSHSSLGRAAIFISPVIFRRSSVIGASA